MKSFNERIALRDETLFDPIPSQTSPEDRRDLLAIIDHVRERRDYTYLEIGSHLGGTLQLPYADPRCVALISIDKRPEAQPDNRGRKCHYDSNSTERMLHNLRHHYSDVDRHRLRCIDASTDEIEPSSIAELPDLAFIDGEHTTGAAYRDFRFCLRISKPDTLIAFHDAWLIESAIKRARAHLARTRTPHNAVLLKGDVYLISLGQDNLLPTTSCRSPTETAAYFADARHRLTRERLHNLPDALRNRHPFLYRIYQSLRSRGLPSLRR